MSYYNSLAFHLRLRKVPESTVAEVLQEVQELSLQSGQDPEQQFGPASTYAEQFPAGQSWSRPTRIATALLGISVAVLMFDLSLRLFLDSHLAIGSVAVAFIVIPLDIAIAACTVAAEHRLPKGFQVTGERSS